MASYHALFLFYINIDRKHIREKLNYSANQENGPGKAKTKN